MCIRDRVYVVKEQELPDGEFPTVSYPNPEADEAFELGLKLAKEMDADLVLSLIHILFTVREKYRGGVLWQNTRC